MQILIAKNYENKRLNSYIRGFKNKKDKHSNSYSRYRDINNIKIFISKDEKNS